MKIDEITMSFISAKCGKKRNSVYVSKSLGFKVRKWHLSDERAARELVDPQILCFYKKLMKLSDAKFTNKGFPKSNGFRIEISGGGVSFEFDYFVGCGILEIPKKERVLENLFSDASFYENSANFESFCEELGYNSDSREAEKIYNDCGETFKNLHKIFGADYEAVRSSFEEITGISKADFNTKLIGVTDER